jgi:hypothetical protein
VRKHPAVAISCCPVAELVLVVYEKITWEWNAERFIATSFF